MDTMTYASFAAFRGNVADKSNQPVPREAELTPLDLAPKASLTLVHAAEPGQSFSMGINVIC